MVTTLATLAAAAELEVHTETVIRPERTGDPREDYWRQLEVFGTFTNTGAHTIELPSATILLRGPGGEVLGIDSIGTAAKRDAGDDSPGETVYAEVHYLRPGESAPFHFLRNLAAIDGTVASHDWVARPAPVVDAAPDGRVAAVTEALVGGAFDRDRVWTGTLTNRGTAGCRSPAIVVALRGPDGRIAAVESRDVSDDLERVVPAGGALPFRVSVPASGDAAWRAAAPASLWVDCEPTR